MLNIRGLEAFYRVMQTGTITEAARRMSRTQPQASRLISALEDEVGFRLFEKKRMRLEPTPEAWDLFREAERYFTFVSDFDRNVGLIGHRRANHVRIITTAHIATGILPLILAEFARTNPEATLVVDVLPRVELMRVLPSDNYDIAIVALPISNKFPARKFASHPAVLMMHKDDDLTRKRIIRVEDLVDRKLISLKTPSTMKRWLDDEFVRIGMVPTIRIEVNSSILLPKLVSENLGIALVDWFVARSIKGSNTVIRAFQPTYDMDYAHIASRQYVSKSARRLIEMLDQHDWDL